MPKRRSKSRRPPIFYDTSVGNSGGWRLLGDTTATTDRGADIIPRGTGAVVRKAQTSNGQSALWTNAFPVQAISAASLKVHGTGTGAQTLGITLPLNTQFNTLPGIECRVPGLTPAGAGIADQIVITFPTPVSFNNVISTSGGASVDSFSRQRVNGRHNKSQERGQCSKKPPLP
jgi:hypothetical protein